MLFCQNIKEFEQFCQIVQKTVDFGIGQFKNNPLLKLRLLLIEKVSFIVP